MLNIAAEVLNVDLAVGQRTKKAAKGHLWSRLKWYSNVGDSLKILLPNACGKRYIFAPVPGSLVRTV